MITLGATAVAGGVNHMLTHEGNSLNPTDLQRELEGVVGNMVYENCIPDIPEYLANTIEDSDLWEAVFQGAYDIASGQPYNASDIASYVDYIMGETDVRPNVPEYNENLYINVGEFNPAEWYEAIFGKNNEEVVYEGNGNITMEFVNEVLNDPRNRIK